MMRKYFALNTKFAIDSTVGASQEQVCLPPAGGGIGRRSFASIQKSQKKYYANS